MANNLWIGQQQPTTAANRPTVSQAPPSGLQLHYATDTGQLMLATTTEAGVGSGFRDVGRMTQPAPIAKTADFTATVADLLVGIITVTSASAVAATLPTGTLTDAGLAAGTAPSDAAFEWSLINLGSASGAVTMTAGTGHTYVGNATVAISTSARFRTRKTAANTFVTYRVA